MTKEDIKARLIQNDALFNNIYVVEQQFDIVPDDRMHYGAAITYQDLMELRSDFLEQLVDTVVDWVYSSEKYADLKARFMASGKSEGAAVSQIARKAKEKFRRGDDNLLIQGQLGELLLFHFIQRFKNAVPLLRKMPITTSAEHERYGADAIHYKIEDGKNIIVLGEAKAYTSKYQFAAAFQKAIDSILDTYKKFRSELGLYLHEDFLDKEMDVVAEELLENVLPNVEVELVSLVLYDENKRVSGTNESEIKEQIKGIIQERYKAFDNKKIRNPHLYRRRHENAAELTNYEMANLRGRAGRLMKDFIGRTIVLDEGEFEDVDGYEQQTLFEDVYKDVSTGYGEKFQEYKAQIIDAVNSDRYVGAEMSGYGYLVTYIRQAVLRYGESAEKRMAETGVTLTSSQVAAIKYKLESLSIPREFCLHNRYWDPVILDDIYRKFDGAVPSSPAERGAQNRLSDILKFLRDTESTAAMFNRYVPEGYRKGANRKILCGKSIKWASEIPLSEFLKGEYYLEGDIQTKIEDEIQMIQKTVSFDIPLLIKPVIEMKNPSSMIVSSLQAGAYKRATRKMIDIGIPRELAIRLNSMIENNPDSEKMDNYDYEQWIRTCVLKWRPTLPYWESVQLEFLG